MKNNQWQHPEGFNPPNPVYSAHESRQQPHEKAREKIHPYRAFGVLALLLAPYAKVLASVFSPVNGGAHPTPHAPGTLSDPHPLLTLLFPASLVTTWALTHGFQHRGTSNNAVAPIVAATFASLWAPVKATSSAFLNTLGGTGADYGNSVQPTPDGGYIVTGSTTSFGAGNTDVLLAKFEANGDLAWSNTLGGTGIDTGTSLQITPDGGFIVTGYTGSFGAGSTDVLLANFEANGALTWIKSFGGTGVDTGRSVQLTPDGGFIVTGGTTSFGAGSQDVLLAKFEANGDLTWSKTLGGTGDEYGRSVQITPDGGFIVTGETRSFGAGNYDMLLSKFEANGALTWSKTLGGTSNDIGTSVQITPDGAFMVTGETTSFGAGSTDVLLAKFEANGALAWSKTLGGTGTDYGYSVQLTPDGGFIVTGGTLNFGAGNYDMLLSKFEANGALTWGKTLGGPSVDTGHSVKVTPDGGFIVTGGTTSFGAGSQDVLLAKFDTNGNITGCSAVQDISAQLTLSSINPTVSTITATAVQTINPTVQAWPIASVSQTLDVGTVCEITHPLLTSTSETLTSPSTAQLSTSTRMTNTMSTSSASSLNSQSGTSPTSMTQSPTRTLTARATNTPSVRMDAIEPSDAMPWLIPLILSIVGACLTMGLSVYCYMTKQRRKTTPPQSSARRVRGNTSEGHELRAPHHKPLIARKSSASLSDSRRRAYSRSNSSSQGHIQRNLQTAAYDNAPQGGQLAKRAAAYDDAPPGGQFFKRNPGYQAMAVKQHRGHSLNL